jgi:hypothetical protein
LRGCLAACSLFRSRPSDATVPVGLSLEIEGQEGAVTR